MKRYAAPLWASGQIAVQIFRDVPSLLLLFYMTQLLEVPPALAGIAIFGPKLFWAVICDYAVGFLSDRWRAKVPRRTFLLVGAALAPVAMLLLFGGTNAETAEGRALYIALVLAFYMLVFALFSVPHLAIGTELATTPEASAGVMGWRIAFAGGGLLIGASAAPILVERLGADADAYRTVAAAMAAACSIALIVSWFGAKEARPDEATDANRPTGNWRAIISNRPLVVLFAVLVLQLTASGMSYASLAYLFTFNLAYAEPLTVLGIFVLITSILAIVAQPLWVTIAKRLGKRVGLLIASACFGLTLLSVLFVPAGETMPAYWVAVGMGLFNSGCYLNIYAMLTDIVERNKREEGVSRAGVYSGLFTAGDKIAFAIGGTLLTGSVLGFSGFAPGSAVQSAEAEAGILFAFSIVPGTLFLLTCGMIFLMMREPAAASPKPA
jgi:GPH family glycoside/pentoside/hexuronide:cation symporter